MPPNATHLPFGNKFENPLLMQKRMTSKIAQVNSITSLPPYIPPKGRTIPRATPHCHHCHSSSPTDAHTSHTRSPNEREKPSTQNNYLIQLTGGPTPPVFRVPKGAMGWIYVRGRFTKRKYLSTGADRPETVPEAKPSLHARALLPASSASSETLHQASSQHTLGRAEPPPFSAPAGAAVWLSRCCTPTLHWLLLPARLA